MTKPYPPAKVYLAGPITGLSYEDARHGWREEFGDLMRPYPHIHCFSPMRAKDFLSKEQKISAKTEEQCAALFGTPDAILTRDHNDVRTCDVMVANFLAARRVSVGTCVEFGWAHAYRKPIVLIMEPVGNPHDHLFLRAIVGYIVPSLSQAAKIVHALLTPGI